VRRGRGAQQPYLILSQQQTHGGSKQTQAAPTTLKAAFLEPMAGALAGDVALGLFARSDADYMALFTGARAARCALFCFVCWALGGWGRWE
jgi:hypothetical protein